MRAVGRGGNVQTLAAEPLWSNPGQGEENLPLTRSDKRKTSTPWIRTSVWLGCVADHFSSFQRLKGTPEIINGLSSCVGAQEMNLGWFFTNLTYAQWVIICTLRHSINGSFKSQPTVNGLWALQKQESCSPAHRRIKKAFLPRLQCDGNNRDQTNNSMFVCLPPHSLKVKRFLLKQQFLFHERWTLNHKCVLISLLLLLCLATLLLYSIMPHINFLINT